MSSQNAWPATMDHAHIEELVPHDGAMCVLDALLHWTSTTIHCSADGHRSAAHPLRTASGLLAPAAIEYAAQAMALHGALVAPADTGVTPGYLATARGVRLHVRRLDNVAGALHIRAERLAGDTRLVSYRFDVSDAHGRALVDGRATVVLNTPLQQR